MHQKKNKNNITKLNLIQLFNCYDNTYNDIDYENYNALETLSNTDSNTDTSMIKEIQMINIKNTQYVGKISLSKEENDFSVIFDTGSANFWINSKLCSDPGCENHKQYDHTKSLNYKDKSLSLNVQFGTGKLAGKISSDTCYLGGVKIENQNFAEISKEVGNVFVQAKFDGIVGLSFLSMAAYSLNPVFDNIMAQKRLTNNQFSFFLSRQSGLQSSKLILGGVDKSVYTGKINWHKITDEYYWTIKADSILVNGKDIGICQGGCSVIADTGTSLLTGPSSELSLLLTHLNVDSKCSTLEALPTISFVISGIHYTLTGEEYVMTMNKSGPEEPFQHTYGSNNCAGAFMPLDVPIPHGPAWILGDIFLSKYYTVYDRDHARLGLAVANQD